MFSALSEETEAARSAGADGLIPKPFTDSGLALKIREILDKRMGATK